MTSTPDTITAVPTTSSSLSSSGVTSYSSSVSSTASTAPVTACANSYLTWDASVPERTGPNWRESSLHQDESKNTCSCSFSVSKKSTNNGSSSSSSRSSNSSSASTRSSSISNEFGTTNHRRSYDDHNCYGYYSTSNLLEENDDLHTAWTNKEQDQDGHKSRAFNARSALRQLFSRIGRSRLRSHCDPYNPFVSSSFTQRSSSLLLPVLNLHRGVSAVASSRHEPNTMSFLFRLVQYV